MKENNIKTVRSLKKGTKFKSFGSDDKEIVCTAGNKRGSQREMTIEGKDGTYFIPSEIKVEVLSVFKHSRNQYKQRVLSAIDEEMSKLNENDVQGFNWWFRFKEFINSV